MQDISLLSCLLLPAYSRLFLSNYSAYSCLPACSLRPTLDILPHSHRLHRSPPSWPCLSACFAGSSIRRVVKRSRLRNTTPRLSEPASAPCFPVLSNCPICNVHHPHLITSATACLKIARPAASSSLEILRGGMNLMTSKTEVESKRRPLSAHNFDTFDATPRGGSFPLDECGLNAGCRPSSHASSMATMRPCPRTSTIQSSGFFCISRRKLNNSADLAITFWRILSSWKTNR